MSKNKTRIPSLCDLIPSGRILMNVEVKDWKEAVIAAGNLLLEDGMIQPEYIEAMIATAEELGPYIVIAPGIAMPHARPEAGVIRTGMSFVKLATPVNFGNPNHDPVLIVFALAAMDKHVHVRAMQTLAELLLSKEMVVRLMNAKNVQDVEIIFRQAEAIR